MRRASATEKSPGTPIGRLKTSTRLPVHYGDDAILMVPGMPSMKGKDAIRTALKEFIADPNLSLTFTSASAEVAKSGDIAYTQGFFTIVQSDMKTKKPVTEKGAYFTVYKKQADGSWKAVQDINTTEGSAAPVAPAKKS